MIRQPFYSIILLIFLLILGCKPEFERDTIDIGNTVKLSFNSMERIVENSFYQWSFSKRPLKSNQFILDINNDVSLFTPVIAGEYDIKVSLYDNANNIIDTQHYYYTAILHNATIPKDTKLDTLSLVINPDTTRSIETNNIKVKEISVSYPLKLKGQYTVQIVSKPSLEEARKYQLKLINFGYDAYIQKVFLKNKDEIWWRVRVGNFNDLSIANAVRTQLVEYFGEVIWIDNVRKED
jgi:hypothetical protein